MLCFLQEGIQFSKVKKKKKISLFFLFRKLYENVSINENDILQTSIQDNYLKKELSENLSFTKSVLLYFFETSFLDLVSFTMLLALCILLGLSFFSSETSLESFLPTSNLQSFYAFLSHAQSLTRQFNVFLSVFCLVTAVRLLTLTKTVQTFV
jgi:hypothetical protein